MEDKNVNTVTAATAVAAGDSLLVSKSNTTLQKIDYNLLAKAIIEQYTGSTLAGSAQSLKSALDALNSNLKIIYGTSYESVVAATDDLRSLDVGTYRINGPLPTGAPALSGNWYGYVTIQNRVTTAYRYYELAIGNGSYTNFRKYYGWSQGSNAISWYGVE